MEEIGRDRYWELTTGLRQAKLLLQGYNLASFKQIIKGQISGASFSRWLSDLCTSWTLVAIYSSREHNTSMAPSKIQKLIRVLGFCGFL